MMDVKIIDENDNYIEIKSIENLDVGLANDQLLTEIEFNMYIESVNMSAQFRFFEREIHSFISQIKVYKNGNKSIVSLKDLDERLHLTLSTDLLSAVIEGSIRTNSYLAKLDFELNIEKFIFSDTK